MAKGDKRVEITRVIFQQTERFHPSLIAGLTHASVPYVQNILKTHVATGKITEITNGKEKHYEVIDGQIAPVEPNEQEIINTDPITDFPVYKRFDFVRRSVQMTIEGCIPSLFVTGSSGIGKTYLVKDHLEGMNGMVEDTHFVVMKGHVSPFGLYSILYHNRDNGLIIFDDCDKVFEIDIAANILKAALDSYSKRTVNWFSRTIPDNAEIERKFDFEGQIIFISNVPLARVEPAIKSRTLCINLWMSRDEITEHMRNVCKNIHPEISLSMKYEVLNYIGEVCNIFGDYNLRTFIKALRIRNRYPDEEIWKGLIRATAVKESN